MQNLKRIFCNILLGREIVGTGNFITASTFEGSGVTPSFVIMWPRYFISSLMNSHFCGWSLRLASFKRIVTFLNVFNNSFNVLEKIKISSRYVTIPSISANNIDTSREKVAGAFFKPKGMRRY